MKRLSLFSGLVLAVVVTACSTSDDGATSTETSQSLTANGADVTLSVTSDWGGGYCSQVTIANKGTATITGWSVVVALGGSTYGNGWSATTSVSNGQLTATPAGYNATIAAGQSASFGFCGNSSSSSQRPSLVSATIQGGSSGVGGATSMGGTTAKGGTTSVGGTTAKGGTTSVGGTTAKGGSTSVGGTTAKGGTTSVGGTTAKGGSTSVGGTSGACTPPKTGTSKSNPLFTDVYSADPAPMVDNCTFYIACGHDQGSTGFVMREWYLLKSTDMVNWTRTTPLSLSTFAWANANAWAGQMIKARNGKYYWYVPVNETGGGMAIGVAVADQPEGPWKDALGKPLINDKSEMANWGFTDAGQTPYTIDPTVFIDDDGQAYLQYGGFWRLVNAKLNSDMISISGKMVESTPSGFFEAPYLMKRNGQYYEIYASGSANPTTIDYATSSSPMGPWTRRGTILPTMAKVSGQDEPTNHAGVAEFAGQWYIVYHVSNGPNGGGTYKREVAVDKLFFNSDGTIKPVTPSSGLSF
jgi:hypothetical protein